MLLLRNNKFEEVSVKEDNADNIIAYKSLEQLQKEGNNYAGGPVIYKITSTIEGKWNAIVYVSEYSDKSSLDNYYKVKDTLGEMVSYMLDRGFEVFNGVTQITK